MLRDLGDPQSYETESSKVPLGSELLLEEIKAITAQRLIKDLGAIRINPYEEDVKRLLADPSAVSAFIHSLNDYEQAWSTVPNTSTGLTRKSRVRDILDHHPYVQHQNGVYAVPLAVLGEIANRSDLGIYTQDHAAVTPLHQLDSAFLTLSHNEYWKSMMGRQALVMARRFKSLGKRMDLVMIGDGSGDLGGVMARELLDHDMDFRLIHMDIGNGSLALQKSRYQSLGIPHEQIVSIKGSVLTDVGHIRQVVPDYDGGFFILHEVFDAFRTHVMVSDYYGITELYHLIPTLPGFPDLLPFEPTHRLLADIGNYFHFYKPLSDTTRMIPFSPEIVTCMRQILSSNETVAMYIGDYGGLFVMGEADASAYNISPMRVYGRSNPDIYNYNSVQDQEIDTTADVLPTIVHLSSLFGGTVEQLLSQEDYLCLVDPTLSSRIPGKIKRIQRKAQSRDYENLLQINELVQDSMFISQICNPSLFAAQITKGM
jgi:hypothetical protein